MTELYSLLSGAGDVAMIAVAVGFWRIDKRVSKLEWHLKLFTGKNH